VHIVEYLWFQHADEADVEEDGAGLVVSFTADDANGRVRNSNSLWAKRWLLLVLAISRLSVL
jgi:hypothetical protein